VAVDAKMATVGKLSADSMAAIGRELRLKYKEIIAEGMPERRLLREPCGRPRGLPLSPALKGRPRCFRELFTASNIR